MRFLTRRVEDITFQEDADTMSRMNLLQTEVMRFNNDLSIMEVHPEESRKSSGDEVPVSIRNIENCTLRDSEDIHNASRETSGGSSPQPYEYNGHSTRVPN